MIILHAANFDRKQSYRAMYNCDYKIRNGLIRSGHAVYSFSDRDVARESSIFRSRKTGIAGANKKFLEICQTIRPDLIVLGHADIISNETLLEARARNKALRFAYYNVDPLFAQSNFNAIKLRAQVADSLHITTGGSEIQQFATGSAKVFFMPNPVDGSLETARAFEKTDQKHDIVFCTARSQAGDARVEFMLALQQKLPQVSFGFYGMAGNDAVFGAQYLSLMAQAKMAVNLSKTCDGTGHSPKRNHLYSSDRLAQITGNGLLTFIDASAGFEKLYTQDEGVFFSDLDDLAQKILYYKNNDKERQRIAQGGWKKAHTCFNEKLVAQYMVETTFGLPLSQPYIWAGM